MSCDNLVYTFGTEGHTIPQCAEGKDCPDCPAAWLARVQANGWGVIEV